MTRGVVYCGMCGFDLDLQFDFELTPTTARAEVAKVIAASIGGDGLTCPRCRSEIVVDTLTASMNEDAQVARARAAEAMKKRGVRWSVGTPEGPRSTIWRVWVNGSDAYIAARPAAGSIKVSLHASGIWRSAFTEKHMKGPKPLVPTDRDRVVDRWRRPPEFAPGWTRGFSILIPASEVQPSPAVVENPTEVVWFDPPPAGRMMVFDVLIAAPGATGSEGRGYATAAGFETATQVVTVLDLANGERLWIVAHEEELSREQTETFEELRARILSIGAEAMAREAAANSDHDFRAFGAGELGDGTRFYVDLTLRP
jgi:hypothetical protein